jgi:hypothetical protein
MSVVTRGTCMIQEQSRENELSGHQKPSEARSDVARANITVHPIVSIRACGMGAYECFSLRLL